MSGVLSLQGPFRGSLQGSLQGLFNCLRNIRPCQQRLLLPRQDEPACSIDVILVASSPSLFKPLQEPFLTESETKEWKYCELVRLCSQREQLQNDYYGDSKQGDASTCSKMRKRAL